MASATISRERSLRSVFVGNIPYEATEEQLKDIFGSAGPVVSFRLVYDRESGKPKGYGFCEFQDKETALSAMRNLSGYELNGRSLRVDSAASEKDKDLPLQMPAGGGGLAEPSMYGDAVPMEEVPEVIKKSVQSLPPEQMFELMVQMKESIHKYPDETRRMLLQNPQLAYALLQALVVMKVVDPAEATKLLHPPNTLVKPLGGPLPGMPMEPQQVGRPPVDPGFGHVVPEPQQRPNQGAGNPQPPPAKKPSANRAPPNPSTTTPPPPASQIRAQDQEKAALIMQVLSLTDQQIALLPPEQRQSILILREQIARSKGP
ncbi:uncharacterized protein TRIADDRAFT_56724 [Trichoplax adhaerens]|uniref:RRM domain-containing protein n=1 Tax=Trichoplax adhaerens TaxID=10228 RepID=B3RWE9_TRIAD|nr:hypothetical protein TRIADDRAFT_56724 [Trichoplax adhaerens]EDV24679.1 hypothetical protein TRIADDRAFT_56724 [Trichoplax adhaerens]|eukprot:XP_002112569.1 hypothetical protein TRIADDRAFT_56724 [Trichoplax adhaerens]